MARFSLLLCTGVSGTTRCAPTITTPPVSASVSCLTWRASCWIVARVEKFFQGGAWYEALQSGAQQLRLEQPGRHLRERPRHRARRSTGAAWVSRAKEG